MSTKTRPSTTRETLVSISKVITWEELRSCTKEIVEQVEKSGIAVLRKSEIREKLFYRDDEGRSVALEVLRGLFSKREDRALCLLAAKEMTADKDLVRLERGGWTIAHEIARGDCGYGAHMKLVEDRAVLELREEKSSQGSTVAHLLASNHNALQVRHELVKLPDVLRLRENRGWTVAHALASRGSRKIKLALLGMDDILKLADDMGETVVGIIAETSDRVILRTLAKKKGMLTFRDNDSGLTVAHMLAISGDPEVHSIVAGNKGLLRMRQSGYTERVVDALVQHHNFARKIATRALLRA